MELTSNFKYLPSFNEFHTGNASIPEISVMLYLIGNKISVQFSSIGGFHDEYLVSKKLLINMAAKYGLHIISTSEAKDKFKYLSEGTGLFKDLYRNYMRTERDIDNHIEDLGERKFAHFVIDDGMKKSSSPMKAQNFSETWSANCLIVCLSFFSGQ